MDEIQNTDYPTKCIVDCSHGNSNKDHKNQILVVEDICAQHSFKKENHIAGVMIDSNIVAGKQSLDVNNLVDLVYGKSVTDACVDIQQTFVMLKKVADAVKARRSSK